MWTIKWPRAEDSWAQVRNRPWLYYCCLRSGHQDQLLSSQDPKRWHRPNAQDLWSISGNYSPYCGRVTWAGQNWIPYTDTTKPPCSYLDWHLQRYEYIHKGEMVWGDEPQTVTRQHHNLVANASYKQILRERPKTRHCNQEQTRNKLPAHWYVHPHWKEHFR